MSGMLVAGWDEAAVAYGGALLVWALALYVVTRGGPGRIPVLAALAMLALSVYLLGQAVGSLAPDLATWARWVARTWPGAALGPALWLLLTLAMAADEGPEAQRPRLQRLLPLAAVAGLVVGVLLAVIGTATDGVLRYAGAVEVTPPGAIGPSQVPYLPGGAWFGVYRAYALVCLLGATATLLWLWRASEPGSPLRARFGWLLGSAVLFILGVAELTILSNAFAVPGLFGHLALILGMAMLGWNLARYGALVSGEVVGADLIAFGLSMLAVVAIYGALIFVLAPIEYVWLERALPMLLVVMLTHVVIDTRGHLLDRLLYGPVLSGVRGQLQGLANRVVRQPDAETALVDVRETVAAMLRSGEQALEQQAARAEAPDVHAAASASTPASAAPAGRRGAPAPSAPAEFRLLVEGALRHLNDLPALSDHALLSLVAAGTALEGAMALRNQLVEAIERLRPPGARPTPGSALGAGGWLHYLVLHEAYVDGRPNKQIMQRYLLSEGTFHRARRRAVDAVALDLWQRQAPHPEPLRGSTPTPRPPPPIFGGGGED